MGPTRIGSDESQLRKPVRSWDDPEADKGLKTESDYSYKTKEGIGRKGIFIETLIEKVPFWKLTTGDKYIDIIPFWMGPQHPRVLTKAAPLWGPTHIVEVFVHKNIGPSKDRYICPAANLHKPCPVCEYLNELSNKDGAEEESKKAWKAIGHGKFPTSIYNIWDRDDETKGVQVLSISKWFLERHLQTMAKNPRQGGNITYANYRDGEMGGRHIGFHVEVKGQNMEVTAHQFYVRKEPIPQHILDGTYQIDDFLHYADYNEIAEAFYGEGEPNVEAIAAQAEAGDDYGNTEVGRVAERPGGGQPTGEGYAAGHVRNEVPVCPFAEHDVQIGLDYMQLEECKTCQVQTVCGELQRQLIAAQEAQAAAEAQGQNSVPEISAGPTRVAQGPTRIAPGGGAAKGPGGGGATGTGAAVQTTAPRPLRRTQ